MEIYILDALLRPIDVVDTFVSLIWTERFAEMGDFELVTLSTPANRKRFVADTMLSIPDSKRIMRVKTIEEKNNEDTGPVLTIKGKDLVQATQERLVINVDDFGEGEVHPTYHINSWPKAALEFFFFSQCLWGDDGVEEVFPFIQAQTAPSLYPADTIPDPAPGGIIWEQKPDSLYNTIRDIADAYDLGFRLYKHPDLSALYFEAYTGSDRTSSQSTYPPVVFSNDMENLENTNEFTSYEEHFNVIRVMYIHTVADVEVVDSVRVYEPGSNFVTGGGFDRKVKGLVITSVPDDVPDLNAYLVQLGEEELAKSRTKTVFDGEVSEDGMYLYERDYFLGDLVEVRGDNGATAVMRVVEHIIKEDETGKSSYPSLVTKEYNNPGTWLSWKYDVEWSLFGDDYWADQ